MKKGKKINMSVQVDNKCYVCQECGYIANWTQEGDNKI